MFLNLVSKEKYIGQQLHGVSFESWLHINLLNIWIDWLKWYWDYKMLRFTEADRRTQEGLGQAQRRGSWPRAIEQEGCCCCALNLGKAKIWRKNFFLDECHTLGKSNSKTSDFQRLDQILREPNVSDLLKFNQARGLFRLIWSGLSAIPLTSTPIQYILNISFLNTSHCNALIWILSVSN